MLGTLPRTCMDAGYQLTLKAESRYLPRPSKFRSFGSRPNMWSFNRPVLHWDSELSSAEPGQWFYLREPGGIYPRSESNDTRLATGHDICRNLPTSSSDLPVPSRTDHISRPKTAGHGFPASTERVSHEHRDTSPGQLRRARCDAKSDASMTGDMTGLSAAAKGRKQAHAGVCRKGLKSKVQAAFYRYALANLMTFLPVQTIFS